MKAMVARPRPAERSIPEKLLPWIALLGALSGALFSGVQYLEAKGKARVDRVFDYVKEFKTDALMRSQGVVGAASDSLTHAYTAYMEQLARDPKLTKAQRKELKNRFYFDAYVLTYRNSAEFRSAVARMSLFYEELAICAEQELCDKATALSFFSRGATDFLDNTKPILCQQRFNWNDADGTVVTPAQQRLFKQRILRCDEWRAAPAATGAPS